jgi:hypothetical protein
MSQESSSRATFRVSDTRVRESDLASINPGSTGRDRIAYE